ncbi:hypothetical protein HNV12_28035, partial [Methanococcoides sp. SA1]|nr:hypothetical protein [Methanococcoides sp. SA1]
MSELPWENKKGNANSSNEHLPEPNLPWESEKKKDISVDVESEVAPDIFANTIRPPEAKNSPDNKPEITVHPAFIPKITSDPSDKDENITMVKPIENDNVHINQVERTVPNIAVIDGIQNTSKKAPLPLFEPDLPENDIPPLVENNNDEDKFPSINEAEFTATEEPVFP